MYSTLASAQHGCLFCFANGNLEDIKVIEGENRQVFRSVAKVVLTHIFYPGNKCLTMQRMCVKTTFTICFRQACQTCGPWAACGS